MSGRTVIEQNEIRLHVFDLLNAVDSVERGRNLQFGVSDCERVLDKNEQHLRVVDYD